MITQYIYLEKYDWKVKIYYSATKKDANNIIEDIIDIGCTRDELEEAISFINNISYNSGFTYSNPDYRSSVIVISDTTSGEEFQDTFDHEKGHLAMHICIAFEIDPFSEEFQYLVGGIGRKMYKIAKHFLCDKCRRDH